MKLQNEILAWCSQVKAANILDIPVVVTEQYSKGTLCRVSYAQHNGALDIIPAALGHTVSEIDISRAKGVFDKTVFSMVIPEVQNILDSDQTRKSVVLFGIEVRVMILECIMDHDTVLYQTQVCVQQTALDLVGRGFDVHVLADAVSSRTQVDRMFALDVSSDNVKVTSSLTTPGSCQSG